VTIRDWHKGGRTSVARNAEKKKKKKKNVTGDTSEKLKGRGRAGGGRVGIR